MKKQLKKGMVTVLAASMVATSAMPLSVLAAEPGWKSNETGWYYQNADGSYQNDGWFQDADSNWYYFGQNGYMTTGWLQDATGRWFFADTTSGMMRTGWIKEGGRWYWMNPISDGTKGTMQTGWISDAGKWYYMNPSNGGAMQTGWVTDGTNKYFCDASGVMVTGVVQIDGKTYYFNEKEGAPTGAMQTGSVVIDRAAYTFNVNGEAYGTLPMPKAAYSATGETKSVTVSVSNTYVSSDSSSSSSSDSSSSTPSDVGNVTVLKGESGKGYTYSDGTYTINAGGNFDFVNVGEVDNIVISSKVGKGTVEINNAIVLGDTEINGGGENSIHFNNTILNSIKVAFEKVRVVFDKLASETTQEIEVASSAKLEGINKINAPIKITGSAKEVNMQVPTTNIIVDTSDVAVNISKSSDKVTVTENSSSNTNLNITEGAQAGMIQLDGEATLSSETTQPAVIVNTEKSVTVQTPVGTLAVQAATSSLKVEKEVTVLDVTAEAKIELTEDAKVEKVTATENVTLSGTGTVDKVVATENATVKSEEGSDINVPDKTIGHKITVVAENATVVAPSVEEAGKTVTVTIVPNEGYSIQFVKLGEEILTLKDNTVTFTMGDTDVTLEVNAIQVIPESIKADFGNILVVKGEDLDLTGKTFTVFMSDDSKKTIPYSSAEFKVEGFDKETVGTQTVVISYQGIKCEITVEVIAATLENLSILTPPTKLQYVVGEQLDTTGLVLQATWSDQSTTEIQSGFTAEADLSKAGENIIVTVTYGEKTVTYTITVNPKMYAVTYSMAEEFEISGLKESYAKDDNVTFTVKTKENYRVTKVTYNGTEISSADGTYTFTMPEENVTIIVETEKIEEVPTVTTVPVTVAVSGSNVEITELQKVTDDDTKAAATVNIVSGSTVSGSAVLDLEIAGGKWDQNRYVAELAEGASNSITLTVSNVSSGITIVVKANGNVLNSTSDTDGIIKYTYPNEAITPEGDIKFEIEVNKVN